MRVEGDVLLLPSTNVRILPIEGVTDVCFDGAERRGEVVRVRDEDLEAKVDFKLVVRRCFERASTCCGLHAVE